MTQGSRIPKAAAVPCGKCDAMFVYRTDKRPPTWRGMVICEACSPVGELTTGSETGPK
jgi:hypothetical protein